MTRERIQNLWRPDAPRAPEPADLMQALAKVSFDALVLIELRGNVAATSHTAALDYLREVRAEFNSRLVDLVGRSLAAGRVALIDHRPSLTLFERARIVFAFGDEGLIGMAPTHFYRGLP